MSIKQIEEIMCPCGEIFDAELLSAISVSSAPELKEMLISGEINVVCCPKCGEMFYAERFILYHDTTDELIAFVYPASFSAQAGECRKKMLVDFKEALKNFDGPAPDYEPLLFFGIEELASVIKAENSLKDEEAVVTYLAENFGLNILELPPAKARMLGMPKIIPACKKESSPLNALKKIIEHNVNLVNYAKLFIRLSKDAGVLKEVISNAKAPKRRGSR